MATRKNPKRPYTRTEQVQTTLTKHEREQLDARATELVVSRAELIHRYITAGLNLGGFDVADEIQRLRQELFGQ
jgi:hypothetical protein